MIRKAKVEDAFEIRTLVLTLSHFYLENKDSHLPEWFEKTLDLSEFQKRLNDDSFLNFVYSENAQIIAYISIKNKNHIFHLFVDKEYQRQGISKQLWEYAMNQLTATTFTVRSSIYAIPVYKSFGFKITESQGNKDGLAFQSMKLIL